MSTDKRLAATLRIEQVMLTIRRQRVMLDSDLAAIYGVRTKALNQAISRNAERFPPDFVFRLTAEEMTDVKSQSLTSSGAGNRSSMVAASASDANQSQFVTSSQKHRSPRFRPYAFTEHGALMARTCSGARGRSR
jgi:AmiR/NasT family two-component response regulator